MRCSDWGDLPAASGREGFTLIEVMLSLLVISFGILPLFGLLLSARQMDQQAQIQAAAYHAAREELETLRAASYANRGNVSQASFSIPAGITARFPNQAMTGSYSISTASSASPPMQQIVVRVSWLRPDTPGPVTSSVQLDTLIAQGAGR